MNQLAERGINGWKYLADAMGISVAEVMDLSQKGAIDATTAINAVVKGMQANFAGGMDALSKTVPGLLSTIKDNAGMVLKEIGDKLTESLNLQGVLQSVADALTQFSSAVKAVGIKEAMQGLIPPKLLAAIPILAGALIGMAAPAMYAFAISAWAAIAPLAPFIAAGAAVGLIAYEIWNNWEPLSELFSTLWATITQLFSDAWSIITSIIDENLGWAINYIDSGWNSVSEVTGSVWSGISEFVSSAWETIKSIVASGVQWIVNKMQPLLDLIGKAMPDGVKNLFNDLSNGIDKAKTALGKFHLGGIDISNVIPQANKPNTKFTGLHGPGASSAAADDKGKKKKSDAEKEWEKLEKKAEQVSKSIEREWVQLTNTKIEQLDKWLADELTSLNESAAANENYQRDLTRLNEIYAEKKKKILYDQQKETNSIWDEAISEATEYQNRLKSIGMLDGSLQVFNIKTNAENEITKIKNAARDAEQAFAQLNEESKLQTIQAWVKAGKQFTITKDGIVVDARDLSRQVINSATTMANTQVSLARDTQDKILTINKDAAEKLKYINKDVLDHKSTLNNAYETGNVSAYIAELNEERAALALDLAGRQAMMDEYYTNWRETHKTSMEVMADAMGQFRSGMTNVFKDMIKGVNGAKSLWVGFRDTVIDIIADIYAKQLSANLTSSLMSWLPGLGGGKTPGGSTTSYGTKFGTGIDYKFAGGGLLQGPGTGTSDSILMWGSAGEYMVNAAATKAIGIDNLNYMNETGKIPGFATGGLITGPSLSSMSGRYKGSVSGNGGNNGGNVNITVNNHSDAKVTATDGGIMNGIRQIVIEIAPDAVLDRADRSPAYSRNMKAALGV